MEDNMIIWQATLISHARQTVVVNFQPDYHKHDGFDFHIVNSPFLSGIVPFGPSTGVCIYFAADKICMMLLTL